MWMTLKVGIGLGTKMPSEFLFPFKLGDNLLVYLIMYGVGRLRRECGLMLASNIKGTNERDSGSQPCFSAMANGLEQQRMFKGMANDSTENGGKREGVDDAMRRWSLFPCGFLSILSYFSSRPALRLGAGVIREAKNVRGALLTLLICAGRKTKCGATTGAGVCIGLAKAEERTYGNVPDDRLLVDLGFCNRCRLVRLGRHVQALPIRRGVGRLNEAASLEGGSGVLQL